MLSSIRSVDSDVTFFYYYFIILLVFASFPSAPGTPVSPRLPLRQPELIRLLLIHITRRRRSSTCPIQKYIFTPLTLRERKKREEKNPSTKKSEKIQTEERKRARYFRTEVGSSAFAKDIISTNDDHDSTAARKTIDFNIRSR